MGDILKLHSALGHVIVQLTPWGDTLPACFDARRADRRINIVKGNTYIIIKQGCSLSQRTTTQNKNSRSPLMEDYDCVNNNLLIKKFIEANGGIMPRF